MLMPTRSAILQTAREVGGPAFLRSLIAMNEGQMLDAVRARLGVDAARRLATVAGNGVVVDCRKVSAVPAFRHTA